MSPQKSPDNNLRDAGDVEWVRLSLQDGWRRRAQAFRCWAARPGRTQGPPRCGQPDARKADTRSAPARDPPETHRLPLLALPGRPGGPGRRGNRSTPAPGPCRCAPRGFPFRGAVSAVPTRATQARELLTSALGAAQQLPGRGQPGSSRERGRASSRSRDPPRGTSPYSPRLGNLRSPAGRRQGATDCKVFQVTGWAEGCRELVWSRLRGPVLPTPQCHPRAPLGLCPAASTLPRARCRPDCASCTGAGRASCQACSVGPSRAPQVLAHRERGGPAASPWSRMHGVGTSRRLHSVGALLSWRPLPDLKAGRL